MNQLRPLKGGALVFVFNSEVIMKAILKILILVFLLTSGTAQAENINIYTDQSKGITITKPSDWFFDRDETQNLVITVAKYLEPYNDLNPNIEISAHPASEYGTTDPMNVLEWLLGNISKSADDWKVIKSPAKSKVDGHSAAFAYISKSMMHEGVKYPQKIKVWMVHKGNHFILIRATVRGDETNGSMKELDNILRTIKLTKDQD